ncbi:hypothetical protein DPMN_159787 [Dreissena polymorpha]|uniref:Uncharacterized protein n=1 Tax=Dreissena polymorpha TaxID=45954 RepID=A0A9D4IS05_DREPO|nr:hypothetical protein DPMN_159787 [Dreissena polymorpha]
MSISDARTWMLCSSLPPGRSRMLTSGSNLPPSQSTVLQTTTPQTSDSNLHLLLLKELPFKNLKVVHSLLTIG